MREWDAFHPRGEDPKHGRRVRAEKVLSSAR
jgi:hypothetical protein